MSAIHQLEHLPFSARLHELLKPNMEAQNFWNTFQRAVPPPSDLRLCSAAVRGAEIGFETALGCLAQPNHAAIAIQKKISNLVHQVHLALGEDREPSIELERTLRRFTSWRLCVHAASKQASLNSLHLILGMELGLAIHHGREMPIAWCDQVRRDKELFVISATTTVDALENLDSESDAAWFARSQKTYYKFLTEFEGGPHVSLPEKPFDRRVVSQFKASGAFAPHTARAGVLNTRCLSKEQLANTFSYANKCTDPLAHKTCLFFAGFSGLAPEMAWEIPLSVGMKLQQPIWIDVARGKLIRDYEAVAYDSASPTGIDAVPASFIMRIGLPRDIATYLQKRTAQVHQAQSLGDLVPMLKEVKADAPTYPTQEQLIPSWARLRHTFHRILRILGMDNMAAALITANFAATAKSKLYYCTFAQREINEHVNKAYALLGFDQATPCDESGIAFGCQVTPLPAQVKQADSELRDLVRALRPPRLSSAESLIQFHEAYSKLVGLRIFCMLALRATSRIPLHVPVGPRLYLTEKSSWSRIGGLPAAVTPFLQKQLHLYAAHCSTLYQRLPRTYQRSDFGEWLQLASKHMDTYLCTCSPRRRAKPLSSTHVLASLGVVKLAADFGRKLLENQLRLRGLQTCDIDRVLRHEVQGQESLSANSDYSMHAWTQQVIPPLQSLFLEIFDQPESGLGGGK